MTKFKNLFSKATIGTMKLKNKICLGEIATPGYKDGNIHEATIEFLVERARGGAGLIVAGGTSPDYHGLISINQGRLDKDEYIPRLTEMAQRIHDASEGVKIGMQIMHAGRQIHVHAKGAAPNVRPVAPSKIKCRGCVEPHELSTEEAEDQVRLYINAARRLKVAGFDCAVLHGAHGYFISQWISPYTNKRTDKYGGSIEKRTRFPREIIEGIKKECGSDFPVLIKINCEDWVDPKHEQITLEHTLKVAPLLESAGVDEIHISATQYESYTPKSVSPYFIPLGLNADAAAEVRKVVKIPVGVINSITSPTLAEKILNEEKADLIWMTRPLMADPELPKKAAEGRIDEIRTCIRCSTCIDILWDEWHNDIRCAINPQAFREKQLQNVKTLRPKKVLVIGGGPAGLEAARVAALNGHDVALWEKDKKLGGQVPLAAIAPHKKEFNALTRYFTVQMKKLGVKVELKKAATPDLVKDFQPDAIILSTGSNIKFPDIPGCDKESVLDARKVIAGNEAVGEKVVVIGGGELGLETAQVLAEQGKKVTVVVRSKEGNDMIMMVYYWILQELKKQSCEVLTFTKTEEITDKGVVVIDKKGNKRVIEADSVVMATRTMSNSSLKDSLEGIAHELFLAGDCVSPKNIRAAIYQGAMVACMLD